MIEIDKYIVGKIRASTTIMELIGGVQGDYRVYSWEPNIDILFSETKKGAIFYKSSQNAQSREFSFPSQKGNLNYYIQVASPTKLITKQVTEELDKLFCNPLDNAIITESWKVGCVKNSGITETELKSSVSNKPLYIRTISLFLKEVFSRELFFSSP